MQAARQRVRVARRPRRRPSPRRRRRPWRPARAADLVAEAERLGRAARSRRAAPSRRSAARRQRLHLVGLGHRAQHRQAGAAADVAGQAAPSRRPLTARQPNRPLPRNRFDVGQWAICAPAAASSARSASSSQMPCANTRARCSRPCAVIDVEVAARVGKQLAHPGAPRPGSRRRGSACRGPASARSRRPAIASCSACWSARSAPSPHRPGAPCRASARSARRMSRSAPPTSSRRSSGALRSISTLPAMTRMPRASAALEQRVDRRRVHGREDHRRGRAVGEQRIEEARGRASRHCRRRHGGARPGRCRSRASRAARCRSSRSRRAAGCARGCR